MLEAGWLLLLLFLGCCSLIVVAMFYPAYRRSQLRTVDEAHATTCTSPAAHNTMRQEITPTSSSGNIQRLTLPEWLAIFNDRPDDAPHTLIVGISGTGKTTLAHAIAVARSGKLVILDPKWKPGKWAGVTAVPIDDDGGYTHIEAALKTLLTELAARLVALKDGESNFEELTVVAEELPTLITECPSASTFFKQVGRLGRELRICMIGLSQSDRVKSLGIMGEGDALDNYTLIRLGKTASAAVHEARTMPRPAVLA
jgi:hypothetical protein